MSSRPQPAEPALAGTASAPLLTPLENPPVLQPGPPPSTFSTAVHASSRRERNADGPVLTEKDLDTHRNRWLIEKRKFLQVRVMQRKRFLTQTLMNSSVDRRRLPVAASEQCLQRFMHIGREVFPQHQLLAGRRHFQLAA